jgi:dihydrofolate reductase/thymidylate synthase
MTDLKYNYPYQLNIITAYTFGKQGIGKNGTIPWHIPEDLKYFKEITAQPRNKEDIIANIVIMGRRTWESLPTKPLAGRVNIVLSNNEDYCQQQNALYNSTLDKGFDKDFDVYFTNWDKFFTSEITKMEVKLRIHYSDPLSIGVFKYFIIGGEQIYNRALEASSKINLYTTEVYTDACGNNINIDCDAFFPKINIINFDTKKDLKMNINDFQIIEYGPFQKSSKGHWYRFVNYSRPPNVYQMALLRDNTIFPEETAYLTLMRRILETGQSNDDRTGVGTLSLFGEMLKFNLRDTFPISTTKRLFFRAVFEELMFYISGKTDNKILQDKGIHVWDGNTTKEFLQKRGLGHYQEGDLGQTYGFNMRHFGGEYKGCQFEYGLDVGYDQLANLIHLLKTDPASRRLIIDLWDPASIHKAALPSCLCKYQFNVNTEKKELNLAIYLRSSDYFLANNWNTCTGAIFVHLLCNLEGIDLTPGDLTVFIADAHLYKSHLEQVKENLARTPYPFPKLLIREKKADITKFTFDDLQLIGYRAHPNIKAEMAV